MQPLDQTSQVQPYYRSEDEIDLIDLIGFLWKIRRFIAGGIFLGIVTASSLVFLGQKKAADPANLGMTFSIPLSEDAASSKQEPSLSSEERINKINEMLTLPATAKVFVSTLVDAHVLTPPSTPQQAALSWFISQQKIETEKQKLAKVSVGPAGELQFVGTWPQSADIKIVATAVVDGLNRMIDAFNNQAGHALEAKRQVSRDKIAQIIKIRTQINAMLFRLTDMLGPVNAVHETLISAQPANSAVLGSETEWSKVIRVLGLLESKGKITQAQFDAENQKLAHLQEEYIALLPITPTDTTVKKDTAPTGLLFKFAPHPDWTSPDGKSQLVSETPIEASGVRSSLKKSPMVLIVLGILLGGFAGTLGGGLWQFWRANQSRLKEALSS
jgi:hypothetical protein